MPARSEYAPGTPSWIDLVTPDVPAAERSSGGASKARRPTTIPPGRMAAFADPHGAMFSVLTWSETVD